MSKEQNLVEDLYYNGLLKELMGCQTDWSEFLCEIKDTVMEVFQTLKSKIATMSASNPIQLEKDINIELKSAEQFLNGTKAEVSILSSDSFQCPFGILPDDLKDSLVYFSLVLNAKDESSANIFNEKLNTLIIPKMMDHWSFKSIFEPKKELFVKKIGSQIHLVLSKEIPQEIKELVDLAVELFTSYQNGFKLSNVLSVETPLKMSNVKHLDFKSFLNQLTTLYVNYSSKVNNFDYLLEIVIDKLTEAIKDYYDEDMLVFNTVLNIIRIIKSISLEVNFHPFGDILYATLGGKTDEEKEANYKEGKTEFLEIMKEMKEYCASSGLKEYLDLIDLDTVEIHFVKPQIMLGLNIKVSGFGLNQMLNES